MLEFDIKRIKDKLSVSSFIVIFEVIYLIVIPFTVALNIDGAYITSIVMNTFLVATLIFILVVCVEDFKYELIYNKLIYHSIKRIDFYKSKLIIMSVFVGFQTIFTVVCFVLGHLMVFEPIRLEMVIGIIIITFISMLISSITAIIFCGKSIYSIALVFIPASVMVLCLEFVLNIIM